MNMKRMPLIALMVCLTAMLGIVEPLAAAAPHAASKKAKTAHDTFSSPNAIVIPDVSVASPFPSTVKVSGFKKGKITDVNLRLRGLNHGWADDVEVLLVAPNGQNAIVMSDVGGNTNALSLTLTLDDDAGAALPDNSPLTSGTFQPANYDVALDPFPGAPAPSGDVALSTFNGSNPNGTWKLFVLDDAGGQAGAFSGGWDLKITAKVKNKKEKKHKKH